MSSGNFCHPLVKDGAVELREYQVRLADICMSENTLVVLPTGLGKTVVALMLIARHIEAHADKACLFMAPTRVLAHQHRRFILERSLLHDVSVVTGEEPPYVRQRGWGRRVVCATPQVVKNDMARGLVKPKDLSLVIFDEVHRAVGEYAYTTIGRELAKANPACRLVGITASIPSDAQALRSLLEGLGLRRLEIRDEGHDDVRPYAYETEVEWVKLRLPPVMEKIKNEILTAASSRAEPLVAAGLLQQREAKTLLLKSLLGLREKLREMRQPQLVAALLSLIRLSHALTLLETQGVSAMLRFLERIFSSGRWGSKSLAKDPGVREVYETARGAVMVGIEHPKIEALKKILTNLRKGERAIVFTSYRDSVDILCRRLSALGPRVGHLVGKSGEGGLAQVEQVRAVDGLREGRFDVLVATQVGEEGLDISECGLVVFYDSVPSAIRLIQRRGRTGRRAPGRMVVLLTEGTRDEAYYWTGIRRLNQSRWLAKTMSESDNTRLLPNGSL